MYRLITSALSEKEIKEAPKLGIPVIFLGGSCKDTEWRNELKNEFRDDLKLLDPFDNNYDPKKDVYKELAGIINSDYIVFYKGGEQSTQEKKFLDLIGRRKNLIKEFDDLDSLKRFLDKIKGVKLESISSRIKKCAERLQKEATPTWITNSGATIDLSFESLDDKSIENLLNDIFSGETVTVPANGVSLDNMTTFKLNDLAPNVWEQFKLYAVPGSNPPRASQAIIKKHVPIRPIESRKYIYDKVNKSIVSNPKYSPGYHAIREERPTVPESVLVKMAKQNVEYKYSCAKVDLPKELSELIINWGKKNIPDKDLYEDDGSKGREDDIHVTLFYGIKSDNPDEVSNLISKVKPFEIRLGLINLFKDNEKYDVLKIEVESGDLERLHYNIEKNVDVNSTYPTYKPHVTILFAKKNMVDKWVGDEEFKGKVFKVTEIDFSPSNGGSDKKLPLGI